MRTALESINQNGSQRAMRIGVASIMQETNTWSVVPCTIEDFTCHGLFTGDEILGRFVDTNTEIGGALRAILAEGAEPVPLIRAWANSSGRVTRQTLDELGRMLQEQMTAVNLDALVLSLHGAMVAENADCADGALLQIARAEMGAAPIVVCLDLHANVTEALVASCDAVIGYHTYPHTDMGETGARAARLVIDVATGRCRPTTALAKRPMLIPAETMSTVSGPLAELRDIADKLQTRGVIDISLFPVQPWLDVDELGFGVTVTTDGDRALAESIAEELSSNAWERRGSFAFLLRSPKEAIELARASSVRPFIISESADAPTAGGAGDSPAMVRALLEHADGLISYVTVTDPAAVQTCVEAGQGEKVALTIGCSVDRRFHTAVPLSGVVERIGDEPMRLLGPSYTGMDVSMGRFAVVRSANVCVLITERPAFTLEPLVFAHAGLDPTTADLIVVRSAAGFRAAYPAASVEAAVVVDLPGVSTPRLDRLKFVRAPRPMYPLDPELDPVVVTE